MSELDGASPKEMDNIKKMYVDPHIERQAHSLLSGDYQNIEKVEPGDKNAKNVVKLKKPIELDCAYERAEKLQGYIHNLVEVRADDGLDRQQLPMKDLLKIAVSTMPKNVNINANVTNTFADLWTEAIDVEGEVVD